MLLSQKTKLTNRKFYNKWLYKTSLKIKGCSILRSVDISQIKEELQVENVDHSYMMSSWRDAHVNKDHMLQVCDFLDSYDPSVYSLRIERSTLDIYTNDVDFYEQISQECQDILVHRFEPSQATSKILEEDQYSIAVDKLPKNRYNYRVYLLPHRMGQDRLEKSKFVDWLKKQNPKITCTPAIESWFIRTDWNWDRRYVLVEDEATLLMLKLRNSEVVGRVYKFILTDK